MKAYDCHFIFHGAKHVKGKPKNWITFDEPSTFVRSYQGIAVFMSGFWINADLEITQSGDAKYWIPPSQIKYIEKVEIEEEET